MAAPKTTTRSACPLSPYGQTMVLRQRERAQKGWLLVDETRAAKEAIGRLIDGSHSQEVAGTLGRVQHIAVIANKVKKVTET